MATEALITRPPGRLWGPFRQDPPGPSLCLWASRPGIFRVDRKESPPTTRTRRRPQAPDPGTQRVDQGGNAGAGCATEKEKTCQVTRKVCRKAMLEIASSLDTMMAPDTAVLVALVSVVVVSLLFDFTNGWNDSANAIATVVSTRVLKPAHAVMMNAGMNFVGALVSTTVAQTIASKWVDEAAITQWSVVAAMIAAAGWVAACTRMGIPCSGSHSLMGGIIGAALGTSFVRGGGAEVVKWDGIPPAVIALFLSPLMGLIISYVVLLGCIWLASGERLSARGGKKLFGSLQVLSASFMAFQHGKNDAQKVMGVITLSLLTISSHTAIHLPDWVLPRIDDQGMPSIPLWVILSCATAMAIGTAAGGWEVIRTLGMKLAHIRPMEGFSAEMGAALTLEVASEMGIPVSTTHTITGSIMGVGSVRNPKAVKWNLGGKILIAWILTFPATIAVGWVLGWLLNS